MSICHYGTTHSYFFYLSYRTTTLSNSRMSCYHSLTKQLKTALPKSNDKLILLFFKFSTSRGLPKLCANTSADFLTTANLSATSSADSLPTPGAVLEQSVVAPISGWMTEYEGYSIVCKLIINIRLPSCIKPGSVIKLQQGIISNLSRYFAFVCSEDDSENKHCLAENYVTEHDQIMDSITTGPALMNSLEYIRLNKMKSVVDKWKTALKIENNISLSTVLFAVSNMKEKPKPLVDVFGKWKTQLGSTAKEGVFSKKDRTMMPRRCTACRRGFERLYF